MLKRFLKFFKNDDQEAPEFEGSYLDFLLSQVEPGVIAELDQCEEHDPLLLVIAEILRISMRGAWSPSLRRPLLDEHSPRAVASRHAPPPPPPTPPGAPKGNAPETVVEETQEFEAIDDEVDEGDGPGIPLDAPEEEKSTSKTREYKTPAALREAMNPSDEEEGFVPDTEEADPVEDDSEVEEGVAPEETREAGAEDAIDEESDAAADADVNVEEADEPGAEDSVSGEQEEEEGAGGEESDAEVVDELQVEESEILEAIEEEEEFLDEDSELIEEITPIEATAEFDRSALTPDHDDSDASELPRVDQREVLQAGRVFLGMLIENDRLPYDLQLGLEETMLARDLLVGYFVGNADFEDRAQQLLRIVERKFSEGMFSQARILLQLFQTDRVTRIRNDRNIFYEDMIQRLGIRRRHPVAAEMKAQLEKLPRDDAQFLELSRWLDKSLFIKFHLFMRQPQQVQSWRHIGQLSNLDGASENLLKFLPPRRWRPYYLPSEGKEPTPEKISELARAHINADTLHAYITNQMRTCYFVLRAVGDTGLEGFLDTFFDWTREAFGEDTTTFLPEIYRRSMGEVDTMRGLFLDIYNRFLRKSAEAWLEELSQEQRDEAIEKAVAFVRSCNFDDVAPGNYNFGGFIYDQLFGVEYPTKEFAFKLHRLT